MLRAAGAVTPRMSGTGATSGCPRYPGECGCDFARYNGGGPRSQYARGCTAEYRRLRIYDPAPRVSRCSDRWSGGHDIGESDRRDPKEATMTFDSARSTSPSVFNAGLPVLAYEDAEN